MLKPSKKSVNESLSLEVLRKFRIIFGGVRQQFREIEQTCGISGSQLWILKEIAETPGVGVSELAQRISIHQSTCSQLVEKLITAGLLEKIRSQEDQRRVFLNITERARKVLVDAPGPAEGILPEALHHLSPKMLNNLDLALSDLIAHLEIKNNKLADKHMADM